MKPPIIKDTYGRTPLKALIAELKRDGMIKEETDSVPREGLRSVTRGTPRQEMWPEDEQ